MLLKARRRPAVNTASTVPKSVPDIESGEARLPLRIVERRQIEPSEPSKFKQPRRRWTWLLALAVLCGVAALGYVAYPKVQALLWPSAAAPAQPARPVASAPAEVLGLGKLRPAGNVIAVAAPFGAGDARLAEIRIKEGDTVKAGDIIAALDSEQNFRNAIAAARANLEVQRAIVEQTRSASAASRNEAEASLESARAAEEVAKLDYDRTAALFKKGIAAQASLDQKRAAFEQARRAVERAQATLSRFDERNAAGRQDVIVAEKRAQASETELARAERDLEKAYIRAPVSGTVLAIENRIGERPAASGIATMADLSVMIAEVEIYQSSIAAIALGQDVRLESDALNEPLKGRVSWIGLEVKKQSVIDSTPAANTDARVVEVQVTLDPASNAKARSFTNLQVTARIATAARK
jgi:HlyD family secretion protein